MSSQSYGVSLKGDINQLEKVQKRAAKLVYGHQKVSYEERLRRLGLTTLQQRRLRGDDLIETYKIITGKENVDPTFFFTLYTVETTTPEAIHINWKSKEVDSNCVGTSTATESFIIGINVKKTTVLNTLVTMTMTSDVENSKN